MPDETVTGSGSGARVDGLEAEGDQIGPYRLISVIGEGGFGIVWLAERRQPFVQRVALKIIKPGMDSKAVVARFEQERQSLAVMAHPGIARVLDGGLTQRGRPYFVMEYVPGERITQFADDRRLSLRDRLRLFVQVCEAVQHAHLKGIIHRDLKPTNILAFDVEGGEPSVKVIDFGVAKATQSGQAAQTVFTETGQMIGTQEYMSPEQADPTGEDIDTRSDVYSLGVVLYELLSGLTPIDPRELRAKAYREQQRLIAELDPPTPSTRLSTVATKDTQLGARIGDSRREPLPALVRSLRRELEWIPLKAMRRERQDRYQSATDLARDVRNYLDGKPLVAGPESSAYRVRKFVRRHRGAVLTGSLVAASLLIGLGLATWQWREAVAARDAAQLSQREATAVKDFVLDALIASDPKQGGSRDVTVREAMAKAAAKLDSGSLRDQPEAEAALQLAIGIVLAGAGDLDGAMPLLQASVATRERVLGPHHPEVAQAIGNLASVVELMGRDSEAEKLHRRALASRCSVRTTWTSQAASTALGACCGHSESATRAHGVSSARSIFVCVRSDRTTRRSATPSTTSPCWRSSPVIQCAARRSCVGLSPSRRHRWPRIIRILPHRSPTSPTCAMTLAGMAMPRPWVGEQWRSGRSRSAPNIRTRSSRSAISPGA